MRVEVLQFSKRIFEGFELVYRLVNNIYYEKTYLPNLLLGGALRQCGKVN